MVSPPPPHCGQVRSIEKKPWLARTRPLPPHVAHVLVPVPGLAPAPEHVSHMALDGTIRLIVRAVRETLERTPPELSADISDSGIMLNGGGSLLRDFDKRITRDTGLPARWTDDPMGSVTLGAGQMLERLDLLRRLAKGRSAA